ncbi:hypothetical protein ACQELD_003085, partial [Listeria monocytogenes]
INVCGFLRVTLSIHDFMHGSKKPVPATFTLIFVLVAFVTILHRILHILNVVNPHFSDATPIGFLHPPCYYCHPILDIHKRTHLAIEKRWHLKYGFA